MKELLRGIVQGRPAPEARNAVREYLQARILGSLQRAGAMVPLAFQGGTALRFLYGMRRFSEDLDFALERPCDEYAFRGYVDRAVADLVREGYSAEPARLKETGAVHSAFVRIAGLLHELGVSAQRHETLAIKLEVDTSPPAGAVLETTLVRKHGLLLNLQHHDRASLLSGKLHAVLQRPYPKGRDFYDLLWYLADSDWPAPNLELLNNALRQTKWPDGKRPMNAYAAGLDRGRWRWQGSGPATAGPGRRRPSPSA